LCSGNFDRTAHIEKLEKTVGALPVTGLTVPEVPPYNAKRGVLITPFAASEGVAHERADFPLPKQVRKNSGLFSLAFSMLDDCSSKSSEHGKGHLQCPSRHMIQKPLWEPCRVQNRVPQKVKSYVEESIQVFLDGKCLAADSSEPELLS
jgi:hypothetical protein